MFYTSKATELQAVPTAFSPCPQPLTLKHLVPNGTICGCTDKNQLPTTNRYTKMLIKVHLHYDLDL